MTDGVKFLGEIASHVRRLTNGGPVESARFPRLNSSELVRGVETGEMLVGALPPQPSTLRGRVGKILISLVRRSLFWYTPAIHVFQRGVAAAFREQHEAIDQVWNELSHRLLTLEQENESLHKQLRSVLQSLRKMDGVADRIDQAERQTVGAAGLAERVDGELAVLRDTLQNETTVLLEALRERMDAELAIQRDTLRNETTVRLDALSERLEQETSAQAERTAELQALGAGIAQAVERIRTVDRFALSTRSEMMLLERRLSPHVNQGREPAGMIGQESGGRPPQPFSDAVYFEFEAQFRGSEEEIKERTRVYVPRFVELQLGSPDMPILDVGCGRGEWLEVLRENRLLAYGVDANTSMTAVCRAKALAVEEQDGIEFVKSLPAGSVGAVTAFHFIEHLPFPVLLSFIDEVVRVLKPGGAVLFETPNPDNLVVGACNFYFDPTHQRPIPAGLLSFLMRSRGFDSIEVATLHPAPGAVLLDGGAAAQLINDRLFGCQDYSLVALKVK